MKASFATSENFGAKLNEDSDFNAEINELQDINAIFSNAEDFWADLNEDDSLLADFGQVQAVVTSNYEDLENLPYINDVEVIGRKTGDDYKLQNKMDVLSVQEIEKILYLD